MTDYICDICGWTTTKHKRLQHHKKLRHSEDPVIHKRNCVNCEAFFTNCKDLSKHYKMEHGGALPFMCETCPQSFLRPTDLEKHRYT